MALIDVNDFMDPDVWTDFTTKEVHHDTMYVGPHFWAEQQDDSIVCCGVVGDDMWLVASEIHYLVDNISEIPEGIERGLIWHQMRMNWREDVEHYVMEVPTYSLHAASDSDTLEA